MTDRTQPDPDDLDDIPMPSDEDMAAAEVLADALKNLKTWRLHARVTDACPHCGMVGGCEWLSAMYGLITMFGGYVRQSPEVAEILGIVAKDENLRDLDAIDLHAVLDGGSQLRALGSTSETEPAPRPHQEGPRS